MQGSSYQGIVDLVVAQLAERRSMKLRRPAYLNLARAILSDDLPEIALEPEAELTQSIQAA
jgi:hypothetical protein